jgi:hypothetical protein
MWWLAAIIRPLSAILFFWKAPISDWDIAFHFSEFELSWHPVLHRELVVLFFPLSISELVCLVALSWPSKRRKLLRHGKISELNVDTDGEEARVSSYISSGERGCESVPGLSQPQLYHQTASNHKPSISISCSASNEEDAGESGPGEQIQQPVTLR